jgi:tetratricopeptide (TPR) repeat protein
MKRLRLIAALLFIAPAIAQVRDGATDFESTKHFGEAIARAFNERDAKAMDSLIDLRSLAMRAAKAQGLSPAGQDKYVRDVESAGSADMIANYMTKLNSTRGTALFMRATNEREARALVRLDFGEQGFDYLEYVVETMQRRVRAVDWFQLSTGELASVTMGGVSQMFTTKDAGVLKRLFGVRQIDQATIDNMSRIGELQRQMKYAEALALMKKLPDPIANSRYMLAKQGSFARASRREDEYTRILSKLAERYSDDPASAFLLIDHYFTVKDLPGLLKAFDTIEKRVGVDGVTRHLRAAAYCQAEEFATCLKYADESARLEPDRMDGYDLRAAALVGLGRFADAVAQYRAIEKQFGLTFTREIFAGDPAYSSFIASQAFKNWLPR